MGPEAYSRTGFTSGLNIQAKEVPYFKSCLSRESLQMTHLHLPLEYLIPAFSSIPIEPPLAQAHVIAGLDDFHIFLYRFSSDHPFFESILYITWIVIFLHPYADHVTSCFKSLMSISKFMTKFKLIYSEYSLGLSLAGILSSSPLFFFIFLIQKCYIVVGTCNSLICICICLPCSWNSLPSSTYPPLIRQILPETAVPCRDSCSVLSHSIAL